MECYYDDDSAVHDPVLFCKHCDEQLHKPLKKSKHKRKPFLQLYGDMKTVAYSSNLAFS